MPPLRVEYVADRIDIDEPLRGYLVRCKANGHLQGFITYTTFTHWQHWFQWNSLAPEAGLQTQTHTEARATHGSPSSLRRPRAASLNTLKNSALERDADGGNAAETSSPGLPTLARGRDHRGRNSGGGGEGKAREFVPVVDSDNAIAESLEQQERSGDPHKEGVIWPRVAEISLVGGLRCGRWLVNLVIEELETSGEYDWIVLQATADSQPFYQRLGFVRVGAIARYTNRGVASRVVGYRHWTFAYEPIHKMDAKPSIMMAYRLNPRHYHRTPKVRHACVGAVVSVVCMHVRRDPGLRMDSSGEGVTPWMQCHVRVSLIVVCAPGG